MTDAIHCPICGAALPPDAPHGECPRCLLQAGFESQPAARSVMSGVTATRTSSGHSHFVPPGVEELQQRIPQYEILELIGQGGMGAVYKARQRGLERLVAIKILPFEISQSAAFAERFTREARALAMLNHPHIVAVHDFGQAEGMCYFVMEYVAGVNLRQALQAGKMNPAEALAIVPQICEALQFAHDEGVVHRDIKPENILIDMRGRVKIADFGLAKLLGAQSPEHSLTGTQQVMGTLRYMAPEQMFGSKEVDHRADIFSLGVVFYELLTGELPIGRFAPPSKKRASVDARLDDVVLRALEAEPEQRYQHVSEMKTGVEAVARAPAAAPIRPTYPPAAAPRTTSPEAVHSAPLHPFLGTSYHLAVCFGLSLLLLWFLMHAADPMMSSIEGGDAKLIQFANEWGLGRNVGSVFSTLMVVFLALAGATGFAWWQFREAKCQKRRATGVVGPLPPRRVAAANPADDSEAKLSPAALFGALITPLFLVTVFMFMGSMVVFRVDEASNGQPPAGLKVMAMVLVIPGILGIFTPFATTLLGILGISQIRNSRGKLYGMPLAVFDSLVFPLLLLDLILLSTGYFSLAVFISDFLRVSRSTEFGHTGPLILTFLFVFPAVIALDVWLVRLTWKSATRGLPGTIADHQAAVVRNMAMQNVAVQPLLPQHAAAPVDTFQGPRLSQPALWGAIVAPVVLLPLLVMLLVLFSKSSDPYGPAARPTWVMMPVLCVGSPGFIAPFITTLLGVIAIGQIRRSDGKLYGMPLALFDAIVFPLLLLDAVLMWMGFMLSLLILMTVLQLPANRSLDVMGPLLMTVLLVLPMIVVLNFWLVRLAWQAATKGLPEYGGETKPLKEPPPFRPHDNRGAMHGLLIALGILALLLLTLTLGVGVIGAYWLTPSYAPAPARSVELEHSHGEFGSDDHSHDQMTPPQMIQPAPSKTTEPAAEH